RQDLIPAENQEPPSGEFPEGGFIFCIQLRAKASKGQSDGSDMMTNERARNADAATDHTATARKSSL
ncbi:MAG TPA: hypothetical protein VF258_06590, partial [Luteolibacter sp.]